MSEDPKRAPHLAEVAARLRAVFLRSMRRFARARLEPTVIGETVNLAARLEAAATPGCVLTVTACASDLSLGSNRRARVVEAKGFGAVEAVELSP